MIRRGSRRRGPGVCGLVAVIALVATTASLAPAQGTQSVVLTEVNLPYLHYFGFGAFKVGGQEAWVLRSQWIPEISYREGRRWSLAARLTGSVMGIGAETVEAELQSIGIAAATAGIELRLRISDRSLIRTYTDWGLAFELENDNQAGLGILGVLGEWVFPWREMELGLQPSLDLSGAAKSINKVDQAVGFRWGNEFRGIRIGFGDRMTRLPARS